MQSKYEATFVSLKTAKKMSHSLVILSLSHYCAYLPGYEKLKMKKIVCISEGKKPQNVIIDMNNKSFSTILSVE